MGMVLSRKVVTTDTKLTGWSGVHEGRSVRGTWSTSFRRFHINFLVLSAVCLALKCFLPFLQGRHVLVQMDKTMMVAYNKRDNGGKNKEHKRKQSRFLAGKLHSGMSKSKTKSHLRGENVVISKNEQILVRSSPKL